MLILGAIVDYGPSSPPGADSLTDSTKTAAVTFPLTNTPMRWLRLDIGFRLRLWN